MYNGLVEPAKCIAVKCQKINTSSKNGKKKCNVYNRVNVGLETEGPPHTHKADSSPTAGIAVTKFVITTAAQKLI